MTLLDSVRGRIRRANPDHRVIATGTAWVALFVFFGKLAGAAKEMAVAWIYGVSEQVDAYLFVINLVSWPVSVWFSVLTIVLVPLVARIRQSSATELAGFRAELFGLALVLGLALALVCWFGLPWLLRLSWTGLPPGTVDIAIGMVPALTLLAPLGVLISLFSAWMLAAGRHANTLLESVPALVLLLALLAFSGGSVEPLIWGTVAGFVAHLASLAAPLEKRGEVGAPRFTLQSPQWHPFWQGFGVMLAGQALISFTGIVDQFFAANLGAGAIATFGYANRIIALISGIGATAVYRATLPVFSAILARDGKQSPRVASRWALLMFALGVFAVIIGWWLAPWVVKLLFERGAFTAHNTQIVTEVFRYGLLQLPFYFGGLVMVSALASQGRYRTIAAIASSNLIVKVAANFIMLPWLGMKAILLATALMYMASMLLCWLAVRRM